MSCSFCWTTNSSETGTVPTPSPYPPRLLEKVLDRKELQGFNKGCLKFTEATFILGISADCSALSGSPVPGEPPLCPHRKGRRGRTKGSVMRELGISGLASNTGSAHCQVALPFLICEMDVITTPLPVEWLWTQYCVQRGSETLTSYTKARGWHH